jgi:Fe2+ or Zn2+ uptake regulation protein
MQTDAVLAALRERGHATNLELHGALAATMPLLSLPSVHRITARLLGRGLIGAGPSDGRNILLDARAAPHDHFVCTSCGGIIDLELSDEVVVLLQGQLGRNLVRHGLVIRGRCESCGDLTDSEADASDPQHQPQENQ